MSVLSGLSAKKNVPGPCYLCNQAKKCGIQKCSCCVKRKSSYRHIPYPLAIREHQKLHWCSHSFCFKAYQPRIGINRSGGLFTKNTVCILMVLGNTWIYLNNYRTSLATTQQYERRLVLIAASRGPQREKKPTSNDCSRRPRK